MKLLVNILIIVAILGLAVYQIYKHFQKIRKGGCAVCEYDCQVKQLAKHKSALK